MTLSDESGASAVLRILVISPSCPYPPAWGFSKRVFHLVRELATRHQVTVVSYVPPNPEEGDLETLAAHVHELVGVARGIEDPGVKRRRQLRSLLSTKPFHAAQLREGGLQEAVDQLLARERFDIIQLESSQIGWLRLPPGIPVVVDEHNIESELLGRMGKTESSALRRLYNQWEGLRYARYEEKVWRGAAACTVTSQRDADSVAARSAQLPVAVVPNGVDPAQFRPAVEAPEPSTLVFTGLLSYRPNEDGIRWFLSEILPKVRQAHPEVRLTVVGDGSAELLDSLRGPGVTVTGWVPDLRPYLDAASVAVVPLRMGGGTRLKVVEAMSMSKAIVSTALGAEGIDVVSGRHLELADDPDAFAESIVRLLEDPQLRSSLGVNARELVEAQYSWAASTARLEELHLQLVGAPRAVRRASAGASPSGWRPPAEAAQ